MAKNGFFVEMETQTDDVTGSCTLVTVRFPDGSNQQVIVDCGSFLERERDKNEVFNFDSKQLDACLITHAHVDHIGRLPLLVKNGYSGHIYATKVTANIIPISLEDNFRIMCRDYRNGKRNGNGNGYKPYLEIHIKSVIKKLKRVDFDSKVRLTPNIEVIFLKNGHLFGAASIYMRCSYNGCDDIHILFSGDYKRKNKFFKSPKRLPFNLDKLRMNVVCEATYGSSMDTTNDIFFDTVSNAVQKEHKILVPAFSLGRTQEVLLELRRMQEQGYIPKSYRICHDGGLARKYHNLANKDGLGIQINKFFYPKHLEVIGEGNVSKAGDERRRIIESDSPAIIVSSAGNGSYGPSNEYLRGLIGQESATVLFTGFCTDGTLGRKLIDAQDSERVDVDGRLIVKEATILYTSEFSAHAHADELLEFVAQFENLASVVLTHGSNASKASFKGLLEEKLSINAAKVNILKPTIVTRVDAWGLVS